MNRTTLKKSPAAEVAMLFAKLDRGACELEQIVVGLVPMSPGNLVVLAVCVVVAALSAADFVARQHHRHALREHQRSDKVARLPCAQFIYLRVIGRSLRSAVPRPVVALAVAIIFPVRLIVLIVVRDQIVKREAVMRGDEVDARARTPSAPRIQVRTAGDARGEFVERLIGAT